MTSWGLSQEGKIILIFKKFVNIIRYINRLKNYFNKCRKSICHKRLIYYNNSQQLRNERNFLNLIKCIYKTVTGQGRHGD